MPGCIFAPYFDSEQGAAHFAAVHKVFGASNVSKLLHQIPVDKRVDAVFTICFEAQGRLRDPVFGCVGHMMGLQQQVINLQTELSNVHAHVATQNIQIPPTFPAHPGFITSPQLSLSDLPIVTSAVPVPPTYDLPFMFDPVNQPSYTMQPPMMRPPMDSRQFVTPAPAPTTPARSSAAERAPPYFANQDFMSGDLQELTRGFLARHGGPSTDGTCNGTSNNK